MCEFNLVRMLKYELKKQNSVLKSTGKLKDDLLARRDECPESYCRTPGVGVGVGVHVHKNFNLAYNSWTTIDRAFIFHMCIPCDKTFPWIPKILT